MMPCPKQIDSFSSWAHLANVPALIKLAPAAGATALLLVVLKFARNPFALPTVLVSIPLIFHAVLFATGTSLQQAADAGWVMQPEVCSLMLDARAIQCVHLKCHVPQNLICKAGLHPQAFLHLPALSIWLQALSWSSLWRVYDQFCLCMTSILATIRQVALGRMRCLIRSACLRSFVCNAMTCCC